MRFHIGQTVYIGYSPKVAPIADVKAFMCNVGEITDGPIEAFADPADMKWRSWVVACDGIGEAYIAEFLLSPFDDPGDENVVDMGKVLETA